MSSVVGKGIRSPPAWRVAANARARVAAAGRPAGRKSSSSSTTAAGETPAAAGGVAGPSQQAKGGRSRSGGLYKVKSVATVGGAVEE